MIIRQLTEKLILDESLFLEDASQKITFDEDSQRYRHIIECLPKVKSSVGGIYYNRDICQVENADKTNEESFVVNPDIFIKDTNCGWHHFRINGGVITNSHGRQVDQGWLDHNKWANAFYKLGDTLTTTNKRIGTEFAQHLLEYLHFVQSSFVPSENNTINDLLAHPYIYNIDNDTLDIYCATGTIKVSDADKYETLVSAPKGIFLLKKKRAPNKSSEDNDNEQEVSDNV